MREPGDVAYLGTVLELEHDMPDGSAVRHAWSARRAPAMYWSPKERALLVLPELEPPAWTRKPSSVSGDARRAWETWTGRRATKAGEVSVPAVPLQRAGQGRHILYRSDKWGEATDYIHPFDPGTTVELGPGSPPAVLIVRGPPLRLTARGLEG